jgi:transglutaminase-like putative cysteine protease
MLAAFLAAAPLAQAGAPDWLRALARETLPTYPPDTEAVVLLEDEVTTIQPDGEIKTRYRKAYKILRPGGKSYGTMAVYFDNETRLTFLKGWSIPVRGDEYEVKEKDAIETAPFDGILYQETRLKFLTIPATEPGSVVGYEYEQRHRPYVLQDSWRFQESIPVRVSRFTLQLPAGWEYKALWRNHSPQEPREAGANQWMWELRDLPGIEDEPSMPAWQAVAGRMNLKFFPRDPALQGKVQDSWNDIGRWYAQLASTRRSPSPDIQKKVKELTAGLIDTVAKIRALTSFAQRDVRYVAIEIGIGGYQPHAAPEIFANRYGDCKDKATLLSVMLREIGVESYYVVVNTKRGVAAPEFPSMLSFNHVILALRFPPELSPVNLHAFYEHPRLGRLLFFDPTDNITPLGYIPSYLQNGYGLLVGDADGELLRLPLLPSHVNRLEREAKFRLLPNGTLSGDVRETFSGSFATDRRGRMLVTPLQERAKVVEGFLGGFLPNFVLRKASVVDLDVYDRDFGLTYSFDSTSYAKTAGNLLLVRPRVLGQKSENVLEGSKARQHPVEFDEASVQTDIYEITLPEGYVVDELPAPVKLDAGVATYHSQAEVKGNVLRYQRDYQIKDVFVDKQGLDKLKVFFRQVAADERNSAVLKKAVP